MRLCHVFPLIDTAIPVFIGRLVGLICLLGASDERHGYTATNMYRRRSTPRFVTAMIVAIALLFSQFALAQYVCPGTVDMDAMAEMAARGEPCEGMDAAQPVLCHQHMAAPSQSVDPVKPVAPSAPAVVQVLVVPQIEVATASTTMPVFAEPEVHPPPDPLFLSTLRLRV